MMPMTPLEIGLAIALGLALLGGAWLMRERYRLMAERDVAEASPTPIPRADGFRLAWRFKCSNSIG